MQDAAGKAVDRSIRVEPPPRPTVPIKSNWPRSARSKPMRGRPTLSAALRLLAIWLLQTPATADDACRACHPQAVRGYLETGMGNSISQPAQGRPGSFEHGFSESAFEIESGDAGMVQSVSRNGLRAEHQVEYVIGSGNAAFGFLIRNDDYIYQSPVAYYTKRGLWDMAPGFESHPAPDFDRPVLHECLWCHAGRPLPVPFTQNRYRNPVLEAESISCDRCHGATAAHLAAPASETVINPARLPPAARDSVCEQCHLGGEERVLNPGKTFGDFQPGMRLEQVLSVYVNDFGTDAPGRFKVVSHVEQLALSPCYLASGEKMWCGTCHSPHERPEDPESYFRSKCLSCHGEELASRHAPPSEDCVGCHMIRRPSYDSGHSAFTDHLIARIPNPDSGPDRGADSIRAWRGTDDPGLAQRNLGLAYVRLGRRKQRSDYMDEGASLLARLAQAGALDSVGLEDLGSALLSKQAPPEAGLQRLAADLLEAALRGAPEIPSRYRTVAAAEWQSGNTGRATELLNRAIELDPQNRAAYEVLARIQQEAGQPEAALETWEKYLRLVPQSLHAREAANALRRGSSELE